MNLPPKHPTNATQSEQEKFYKLANERMEQEQATNQFFVKLFWGGCAFVFVGVIVVTLVLLLIGALTGS